MFSSTGKYGCLWWPTFLPFGHVIFCKCDLGIYSRRQIFRMINVKKTSFFDVFLVTFEVFQFSLVLSPILAHQTTKFELSRSFCFSKHPWGHWGHQRSGVKQKLANPDTVILHQFTKSRSTPRLSLLKVELDMI